MLSCDLVSDRLTDGDSPFAPDGDDSDELLPMDLSIYPETFATEKDDRLEQSEIMDAIIGTSQHTQAIKTLDEMPVHALKLSVLKRLYENKDKSALSLIEDRHTIHIDDDLCLKPGEGKYIMDATSSMIDYHLTVANCIGLSPILPNMRSNHCFQFEMDLKKPIKEFKGKHAMLGFDPAGRMLFIGKNNGEDVFIAMAPNKFLAGHFIPPPPGRSKHSPLMSKRHYRQVVMMIAYFLGCVRELSFLNVESVYSQQLDSEEPEFNKITNVM